MVIFVTSGCAYITYTATGDNETLEIKTLWKSLDGLAAGRDGEDFTIIIDKTNTHDPLAGLAELIELYNEVTDMGLRYDPEWRSPLIPE